MKKLFAILTATMLVCGLCVAPAFADEQAAVYETKEAAQAALNEAKAEVPETQEVTKEEVIKLEDKVVTDQEAYDETIEHPAITHEETVVDEEAYDETIEHPAVTHEVTVTDKEAYDEQVCTPDTDPYGYKVEGDNRAGFTVEDGAFVLIKQASDYVVIWSEDADFSDYPTAKEIAAAAKDGSIKNQQVIKWKGLGEFYPGNLGNPWHHWYGFCKNSEGIYFWVDNISGISHADVYVPGKPGECKTVHHDAVTHQETIVDEEAWTETIHHEAIVHQETVVDKPTWTEIVHHDAIIHQVQQWTYALETIDKPVPPTPTPETVVINDNITPVGYTASSYLPKTGDDMITPAGTAFLIILVGLLVLALATPWLNKGEDEED